ncbi:Phloem protein 2-like protein [Corchorus olitorius]|uniref:Phloem protein 2-like protein n=1 Tax=Corchorus olitorius TaxID=93759 RepID=A0A1R3KKF5_9ROSI|nr:Phloem protein 2-like protein [Corchorus olitorius]
MENYDDSKKEEQRPKKKRRGEEQKQEAAAAVSLDELPGECIAKIVSLTTPADVLRLSCVSATVRSAAEFFTGQKTGKKIYMINGPTDFDGTGIYGKIRTSKLLPDTNYAAYLVFKFNLQHGAHVLHRHYLEMKRAKERVDGWLEIEVDDLFITYGDYRKVNREFER